MELLPVADRRLSRARVLAADVVEVGNALIEGPATPGGVALFLDYYVRLKAYPHEEIALAKVQETLDHADRLIANNSESISDALAGEGDWAEQYLTAAKSMVLWQLEEADCQWDSDLLSTTAIITFLKPEQQGKMVFVVDAIIEEIGKRPEVFIGAQWEVRDRREMESPDGMNPHFKKLVEAFEGCYK